MSNFVFNPFTSNFDYVGGSTGTTSWKTPVSTLSALPPSGNTSGDVRVALDTGIAYEWSGSAWAILNGVFATAVSGSSTPDGVSIDGSNNLTLHVADGTNPGLVSTTTQTIAGNKTFTGTISASNLSGTNTGDQTITLTSDVSGTGTGSITTTVNSVGGSSAASINTATALVNGAQSGNKVLASPSNGSSGSPAFRALVSADIPSLSATYVTQTEVAQPNGVASLDSSGKIPATQLPSTVFQYQGSWDPSTNTPTLTDLTGTAGYVYRVDTAFSGPIIGLNDPSMVNFQIGNLVIYSGSVWQQVASADGVTSVNGAVGAVTVNAINQLTGDVTAGPASGSASAASTLATVNSNVGSFGSASATGTFTVNGKGLVTAASSTAIAIVESQVTNLVSDLAARALINTGDIAETSFSASNNVSSAANVTGLLFATASVGSFEALVQVKVSATTPLRQFFNIQGSQTGAGNWQINSTSTGDETGFQFTITSAGQIQYVNNNYTGFTSAGVKFRAYGISV